jgi:hypothetical protein
MKSIVKASVILIMLLIAGNFNLNAQRGMRGMRSDSAGMDRIRIEQRQMPMMMHHPDSSMMRGMQHGMVPYRMHGRGQFMYPGWQMWQQGPGMRRGMGPGMGMMRPGMGMMGRGMGRMGMDMNRAPGTRIIENIPNLTDKQKKDIADIRQNQQDEMQKLRDEMQNKMSTLRESNRTKILNLLTDEQKKWFEENTPAPVKK